jgi:hypothetical protein
MYQHLRREPAAPHVCGGARQRAWSLPKSPDEEQEQSFLVKAAGRPGKGIDARKVREILQEETQKFNGLLDRYCRAAFAEDKARLDLQL